MDLSSKPSSDPITFDYNVKIEVSQARFEFLEAMSYLDLDRLEKAANARIEIGTVETDCCHRTVYGVVEKGVLTEIEFEPYDGVKTECADSDSDMLELIKAASYAIGVPQAAPRKLPISLGDLIANPGLVIETWRCVRICFFGFCMTCCWGENPLGPWGICSLPIR
jgi:hypothetical protein